MSLLKQTTFRSKKWLQSVASLPCQICGLEGSTQAAHRNEGKGMGLKTDDVATAALCFHCHTLIDNGGTMEREERRSEMDRAIVNTLIALARAGLIGTAK